MSGHEMRDTVARALCREGSDEPCRFCTIEAGIAVAVLTEAGHLRFDIEDRDRWLDLNRLLAIKWGSTIIDPTEVVYVLREALSKTGGGAGDTPPATSAVPHPAAQAGGAIGSPAPSLPFPRRFRLYRHEDPSGVSGTKWVAEGVQFIDGYTALRWFGEHPCTVPWDSIERIIAVHGHGGLTEIVWLDGEPS